jgi:hypothetical protein
MSAVVKRILLLSLALVLSFAFVGCGEEKLAQDEIDQIIANTTTASAEVNTGKFDYTDWTMTIEQVGGSEPGEITVVGDGSGVTDNANREMQMVMNMTMNIPGTGEQEMAVEYYVVGGWLYMKIEYPGQGEQWMKMGLSDEIWQQQSHIEEQIDFLKTAVKINYSGSEVVDSTDCYVFQIVPDMEVLSNLMAQQLQSLGIDSSQLNLAVLFKEMSVKEWIAKDTYLVMKSEVDMALEMRPEDVGATESDFEKITIDMNMGLRFYDYNQPVSIELPEGALGAVEVSY